METRIGFFKYDLFPYVVYRKLTGWSDEGDPITEGNFRYRRESLIYSLPLKEGEKIGEAIDLAKSKYREQEIQLREDLLDDLYLVASFLKRSS